MVGIEIRWPALYRATQSVNHHFSLQSFAAHTQFQNREADVPKMVTWISALLNLLDILYRTGYSPFNVSHIIHNHVLSYLPSCQAPPYADGRKIRLSNHPPNGYDRIFGSTVEWWVKKTKIAEEGEGEMQFLARICLVRYILHLFVPFWESL